MPTNFVFSWHGSAVQIPESMFCGVTFLKNKFTKLPYNECYVNYDFFYTDTYCQNNMKPPPA